jgi:hypothetical protein
MDLWNKVRHEGGYWQYFYEVDGDVIASVVPKWGGNGMKTWMCQYRDHVPFKRNSLKAGKADIQWIHEQSNDNNLAEIKIWNDDE